MLASGQSHRKIAFLSSAMLGAATLVGMALMFGTLRGTVGDALPFSAGVTLYVAASDLIPEVNREKGVAMAFPGVPWRMAILLMLKAVF